MAWDFETEPEFQQKLDWVDRFLREEVEPLDLTLGDPYDKQDERMMRLVRPLQKQVKERGLWACHLGPELGGQGFGQVKLALLNELLGRSRFAPSVFGCQTTAPKISAAVTVAKRDQSNFPNVMRKSGVLGYFASFMASLNTVMSAKRS